MKLNPPLGSNKRDISYNATNSPSKRANRTNTRVHTPESPLTTTSPRSLPLSSIKPLRSVTPDPSFATPPSSPRHRPAGNSSGSWQPHI